MPRRMRLVVGDFAGERGLRGCQDALTSISMVWRDLDMASMDDPAHRAAVDLAAQFVANCFAIKTVAG
jgi:hypothetical protein